MLAQPTAISWHTTVTSTAIKTIYHGLHTDLVAIIHSLTTPSRQCYCHGTGKWYHPRFTYKETESYEQPAAWSPNEEVLELRSDPITDPILSDCSTMVQNLVVILTEVIPSCSFHLWHYVCRMHRPEPPWLIWSLSPGLTCHRTLMALWKHSYLSIYPRFLA